MKEFLIYVKSEPGAIVDICKALKDENINILGISTEPIQEYIKVIVDDADRARNVLGKASKEFMEAEAIHLEIENEPGALLGILKKLSDSKINILSVHVLVPLKKHQGNKVSVSLRTSDMPKTKALLGI
jgi:hypothetical protein